MVSLKRQIGGFSIMMGKCFPCLCMIHSECELNDCDCEECQYKVLVTKQPNHNQS